MSDMIAGWQALYAAMASIHLGRHQLKTRTRQLGTLNGIALLYPVLVALVVLMPVKPRTVAIGLLFVALFGIGNSISIDMAEARKPEGQTRRLLFYRYFVPLLASGALGAASGPLSTSRLPRHRQQVE
jgi:hypothetical protein